MKIPKTIEIAGIKYSINEYELESPEMAYGGANGYHAPDLGIININSQLRDDIKEVTLIHELTHGVLGVLNISNESITTDERFVESFSQLWYQIIKQLTD